jgi:hypothetical protein
MCVIKHIHLIEFNAWILKYKNIIKTDLKPVADNTDCNSAQDGMARFCECGRKTAGFINDNSRCFICKREIYNKDPARQVVPYRVKISTALNSVVTICTTMTSTKNTAVAYTFGVSL